MRRFDKHKHIANANMLAEQRYLDSKMSIEEQEFKDMVMAISEDENFFGDTKEKEQLNEIFILTSLAFILSIGKFIDLVGVVYKKIHNLISKKKIDKTKFEKYGEKYTSLLIKGIKFSLKSMGLPDEQSEKVAKIILVCLIVGLWGGAAIGSIEGLHGFAGVAKSFAQLVKSYEVGVAISAILLYSMYDEIRAAGGITDLPHAMEVCLEDKSIIKGAKQARESKMGKQIMIGCIVKNMAH